MNQLHFHDTTNMKGKSLDVHESKAKSQDQIVYEFFKSHPDESFTPAEIYERLELINTPITSIRRAMSNLSRTKDYFGNPITPKLIKLKEKREGKYGIENCVWTLYKQNMQTKLF